MKIFLDELYISGEIIVGQQPMIGERTEDLNTLGWIPNYWRLSPFPPMVFALL